jgi:hypothetical protein
MYTISLFGPFLLGACANGIMNSVLGNPDGLLCNIDNSQPQVVQYQYPKPEESCYKDGIFYPRCKDLENPEVLRYHNLLYTK